MHRKCDNDVMETVASRREEFSNSEQSLVITGGLCGETLYPENSS